MTVIPVQQRDNVSSYQNLRSLYEQNITVNSIAEHLDTCKLHDDANAIKQMMVTKDFDILGVEENGIVIGYVVREELREGTCKESYRRFSPTELVSESTSLLQTLFIFKEIERIFILEGNRITKVVTLADLQKQPIRMLLFGLISLLEMHLYRIINDYFPNDTWKHHLNSNRIKFAEDLYALRKSKNEAIQLSDCLQICDKRDIVLNEDSLREQLGIENKTKGKQFFKKLEELRNNLAHSQDINTENSWNETFSLIEQTENILEKCEKIKK
ncbi:hypothetical protein L1999_14700 [Neobacillus drentensis]|uniref:hypothetical protein n=1 Tax=Neobacillus drentensis TaxID=220684 RepID=UPI001F18C505|nr:hypothetical protein [Neobacillus drentensis]ULT54425.1 hypothetical protein L1999_14700 [Neobacillus drentensis]